MPHAEDIIKQLQLIPHPEGGFYKETWRSTDTQAGPRGLGSMIHYLLRRGEKSHWHRIDATEIWLHQGGGQLELKKWKAGEAVQSVILGPDVCSSDKLQCVIEPGEWQAARALGDYVLVACAVVPGFSFTSFEMAPEHWSPSD